MDRGAWRATVHGVAKSQTAACVCVYVYIYIYTYIYNCSVSVYYYLAYLAHIAKKKDGINESARQSHASFGMY